MSDFVFYPVTGDGETPATAYTWNTGAIAFNTPSFWAEVESFETLTIGGSVTTGTVPSGGNNVGLIAGAIDPDAFAFYTPDPGAGDPYINSNNYPVDVLLNSGSVELGSMVMAGFNEYNTIPIIGGSIAPQFPTLDVEGATLDVTGEIFDTGTVSFPPIDLGPFGTISSATATGGGTIDIGSGGTVTLAGSVASAIDVNFNDASNNVLDISGVSTATPGTFAGTITGWVPGDTIMLPAVPFSVGGVPTSVTVATDGVLSIIVGDPTTIDINIANLTTSTPIGLEDVDGGLGLVTCFAAGSRIRTVDGETAVEDLRPGMLLPVGLRAEPRPIRWIGRRRIDCRRHPHPKRVWPVRIAAHAFGDGLPARDLLLSPDHAVFADGVLIPVRYLIDGRTIVQEPRDSVAYYHVEFDQHDVLLADGLPVESYLDTGDRQRFDNAGKVVALHPEFTSLVWDGRGCAPLVVTGPEVAALRELVAARATQRDTGERQAAMAG